MKNRVEVLTALAEKVMGYEHCNCFADEQSLVWKETDGPDNRAIYHAFDISHPVLPGCVYIWTAEDGTREWNPWDNDRDALALAEVWCNKGEGRWYDHERLAVDQHVVYLFEASSHMSWVQDGGPCSLAAALTGAVCAAEGIEADK